MNKFALLCSVSTLSLVSAMSAAQAQDAVASDNPFYVSLFAGGSFAQDAVYEIGYGGVYVPGYNLVQDYSTGFVLGGTIGMQVLENWRIEAEVSYSRHDADQFDVTFGSLSTTSEDGIIDLDTTYALANVWYDFESGSAFTPYIGGGIGIAHVSADPTSRNILNNSDDDTVFAYQLGAGVSYELTERIALDLGYRFKVAIDPDFDLGLLSLDADDIQTHNIQAAIRFNF